MNTTKQEKLLKSLDDLFDSLNSLKSIEITEEDLIDEYKSPEKVKAMNELHHKNINDLDDILVKGYSLIDKNVINN